VVEAVDAFFTDGKDELAKEVDLFAACMTTNDLGRRYHSSLEKRKASFNGN
jgi:hypothetical protein